MNLIGQTQNIFGRHGFELKAMIYFIFIVFLVTTIGYFTILFWKKLGEMINGISGDIELNIKNIIIGLILTLILMFFIIKKFI